MVSEGYMLYGKRRIPAGLYMIDHEIEHIPCKLAVEAVQMVGSMYEVWGTVFTQFSGEWLALGVSARILTSTEMMHIRSLCKRRLE